MTTTYAPNQLDAMVDDLIPEQRFEKGYGDIETNLHEKAIDRLRPGSDLHKEVLDKLKERLEFSEDYMQKFYARWAINEKKIQAYIKLPDWERALQEMNASGEAPHPVRVIVPFGYAAQSTMVTFLIHTFAGRNPIFQLGTNKPEYVQNARNAEKVLQYNADHIRLVRKMWQAYNDIGLYGIHAWVTGFESQHRMRTVTEKVPQYQFLGGPPIMGSVKKREKRLVYQGNTVDNIDPFMFFPDPRVPMSEVNRKGEFVFCRSFDSKMLIGADSAYKWVKNIDKTLPRTRIPQDSQRALLSRGVAIPGADDMITARGGSAMQSDFVQLDYGTVLLVPNDWGLSDSDDVEMWQFTIGNKSQIIQAERYDCDHGMHPVCVSEPFGFGYAFGQPGPADFIGPLQDLISWLVNSHMDNVRAVLNDQWVVDPSRVEMGDLKRSGPGHRIRLKPSAYGTDVRTALQQLPIIDVTGGHMKDAELFMKMGMLLLGMNENVMGQNASSRRTATESRQSAEAAVSRLAQTARIISAQSHTDLPEQMVLNLQQHMDQEFYFQILGQSGDPTGMVVNPGDITGDFYFPIHDGTLPLDRVAMLDVWKEIMMGVASNPVLAQQYDQGKIFEFIAKLGGAENIQGMKINHGLTPGMAPAVPQLQDDTSAEEMARKGEAIPIPSAIQGLA